MATTVQSYEEYHLIFNVPETKGSYHYDNIFTLNNIYIN